MEETTVAAGMDVEYRPGPVGCVFMVAILAGGGLTWFVYTLSNRVTAIETREKQQKENDDKA